MGDDDGIDVRDTDPVTLNDVMTTDNNADVLDLSGISDDPAEAQQIAQVYAETYIDVRKEQFVAERLETANQLAARIEDLDAQIEESTGADRARLQLLRSQGVFVSAKV